MAVAMVLTCIGCSDTPYEPFHESLEDEKTLSSDNVMSENYWVDPEGTSICALAGSVLLEFPAGAVTEPTLFTVSAFPVDHLELEGYNLINRGVSITNGSQHSNFGALAKMKICYAVDGYKGTAPDPGNLGIFKVSPNIYAYERIESIGECTVDRSCEMIYGCICSCGFYVVGEN